MYDSIFNLHLTRKSSSKEREVEEEGRGGSHCLQAAVSCIRGQWQEQKMNHEGGNITSGYSTYS